MNQKHKELLLKLKTLSEQGIAGEKISATELLSKLAKKYNIDLEELNEIEIVREYFKTKTEFEVKLLHQLSYYFEDKGDIAIYKARKNKYMVECSKLLFIEFCAMFDFYAKALEKLLSNTYIAFLNKNMLFPENPTTKIEHKERSDEEMAEILSLCAGFNKSNYNKQLAFKGGVR